MPYRAYSECIQDAYTKTINNALTHNAEPNFDNLEQALDDG